jgi:uncharacterized protein (TIGR03067 family)
MRTFVLLLCVGLLGCGGSGDTNPKAVRPTGAPPGLAADAEAAALKGTWRVVAITAKGEKVPDVTVKGLNLYYVFDAGKLTIKRQGQPDRDGSFTLDPTKSPRRIDLVVPGEGRDKSIYELTGTTLRLCIDRDRTDYPTAFESKAMPRIDLLLLEKQ